MKRLPALHIVLGLEAAVAIYIEADTDEQAARLQDWITRRPDVEQLVADAARVREQDAGRAA